MISKRTLDREAVRVGRRKRYFHGMSTNLTRRQERVAWRIRVELARDLTKHTGRRVRAEDVPKSAILRVLLDAEDARRS